jgi:hypothetical protein
MSEWRAGPELDAEIARRIFGERIGQYGAGDDVHRFITNCGVVRDLPPYSSDMSAAWMIVEQFTERGYQVHVIQYPGEASTDSRARCSIVQVVRGVRRRVADIRSSDAPLAICRAALRATPE